MHGLHLTADLHDCRCETLWLADAEAVGAACAKAAEAAGLQVVGKLVHAFASTAAGPGGVTATVLLAESHICVHTWPEHCGVTLDVYVCNFGGDRSGEAKAVMDALETLFVPGSTERHALTRGVIGAAQK